jgi:hypothetical protein
MTTKLSPDSTNLKQQGQKRRYTSDNVKDKNEKEDDDNDTVEHTTTVTKKPKHTTKKTTKADSGGTTSEEDETHFIKGSSERKVNKVSKIKKKKVKDKNLKVKRARQNKRKSSSDEDDDDKEANSAYILQYSHTKIDAKEYKPQSEINQQLLKQIQKLATDNSTSLTILAIDFGPTSTGIWCGTLSSTRNSRSTSTSTSDNLTKTIKGPTTTSQWMKLLDECISDSSLSVTHQYWDAFGFVDSKINARNLKPVDIYTYMIPRMIHWIKWICEHLTFEICVPELQPNMNATTLTMSSIFITSLKTLKPDLLIEWTSPTLKEKWMSVTVPENVFRLERREAGYKEMNDHHKFLKPWVVRCVSEFLKKGNFPYDSTTIAITKYWNKFRTNHKKKDDMDDAFAMCLSWFIFKWITRKIICQETAKMNVVLSVEEHEKILTSYLKPVNDKNVRMTTISTNNNNNNSNNNNNNDNNNTKDSNDNNNNNNNNSDHEENDNNTYKGKLFKVATWKQAQTSIRLGKQTRPKKSAEDRYQIIGSIPEPTDFPS